MLMSPLLASAGDFFAVLFGLFILLCMISAVWGLIVKVFKPKPRHVLVVTTWLRQKPKSGCSCLGMLAIALVLFVALVILSAN